MKKFIFSILFISSLVLAGELIYSPLLHNHTDFIEHKDCPAYLIVSSQYGENISFEIIVNFNIPQFPSFIPTFENFNLQTPVIFAFNNKSPPTV